MKQFLEKNAKLSSINSLLQKEDRYKKIRSRCNDHMHYNLFHHMMLNDNEVYNKHQGAYLDRVSKDLRDLFILHFSYLFTPKPHYMGSGDYLDALEMGMTREEGSQYFVAPSFKRYLALSFRSIEVT